MTEVAHRYYPNELDGVTLPYVLGHGITLWDPALVAPLFPAQSPLAKQYRVCAVIEGIDERNVLRWFLALEDAIHFHSGIAFPGSYTVTSSGYQDTREDSIVGWGDHWHMAIDEPAVRFAARTLSDIQSLMLPETFSRVSNAMRLYDDAQMSQNPDFALLGFIGCLESLFSVAPQELSFRLCITMSKFTRDTPADQRVYFAELKQLYTVRSKVAHGDKLDHNEEQAALQLVERWVPTAAHACRDVIFRLLDRSLISIFNNKKQHEQLLEYVLFYPTLPDALAAIQA